MSAAAQVAPEAPADRIQRVYRDTTRPAIYGEYVWKVEYSPAYSHADRWFTSLQAATEHATEQERLLLAHAARQTPPENFPHQHAGARRALAAARAAQELLGATIRELEDVMA